MHCPFCRHTETRVVDSRISDDGDAIRRRRACEDCGERFTTIEEASLKLPVIVSWAGAVTVAVLLIVKSVVDAGPVKALVPEALKTTPAKALLSVEVPISAVTSY